MGLLETQTNNLTENSIKSTVTNTISNPTENPSSAQFYLDHTNNSLNYDFPHSEIWRLCEGRPGDQFSAKFLPATPNSVYWQTADYETNSIILNQVDESGFINETLNFPRSPRDTRFFNYSDEVFIGAYTEGSELGFNKLNKTGHILWDFQVPVHTYSTRQIDSYYIDSNENYYIGVQERYYWMEMNFYEYVFFKYNRTGDYQWNRTFADNIQNIAVDSVGNIYTDVLSGLASVIYKIAPNGTTIWSRTFQQDDQDYFVDIVIGQDGYVYLIGTAWVYPEYSDQALIVKYDVNGNLQWSRRWGGTNFEHANYIYLLDDGRIFLTGTTQSYGNGNRDGFILLYNADGTLNWTTYLLTALDDYGGDLFLDDDGNIYFAMTSIYQDGYDTLMFKLGNGVPILSSPPDRTIIANTPGENLVWSVTDDDAKVGTWKSYEIWMNDSLEDEGTWEDMDEIQWSLESYSVENYFFTLSVTDDYGGQSNDSVLIEIIPDTIPIVDFLWSPNEIIQGNIMFFTDATFSENGILNYQWDFGDYSSNSSDQNPIHFYNSYGIKVVTLGVQDLDGDWGYKSYNITILEDLVPNSDFTWDPGYIVQGQNVQFNETVDEGNGIIEYQWDFGDGSPYSDEANPLHHYTSFGLVDVTLGVQDVDGDWDYETHTLEIQEDLQPIAQLDFNATEIIAGQWIYYENKSTDGNGIISYQIQFGQDPTNSTHGSGTYQFLESGTYDIVLTVIDIDGDVNIFTQQIVVLVDYELTGSINHEAEYYLTNYPIQFTADISGGNIPLIFEWDFGDGSTNTSLQNPNHTYSAEGDYLVTLVVQDQDNDFLILSQTIHIEEDVCPTSQFSYSLSNVGYENLIIEGFTSVDFSSESFGGNGDPIYLWDFGYNGFQSQDSNPSHIFVETGTFTVSLTVFDINGNSSTISTEITVISDIDTSAEYEYEEIQYYMGDSLNISVFAIQGNPLFNITFIIEGTIQSSFNQNESEVTWMHICNSEGILNIEIVVQDIDGDEWSILLTFSIRLDHSPSVNILWDNSTPNYEFKEPYYYLLVGTTIQLDLEIDILDLPYVLTWSINQTFITDSLIFTYSFTEIGLYVIEIVLIDDTDDIVSDVIRILVTDQIPTTTEDPTENPTENPTEDPTEDPSTSPDNTNSDGSSRISSYPSTLLFTGTIIGVGIKVLTLRKAKKLKK